MNRRGAEAQRSGLACNANQIALRNEAPNKCDREDAKIAKEDTKKIEKVSIQLEIRFPLRVFLRDLRAFVVAFVFE